MIETSPRDIIKQERLSDHQVETYSTEGYVLLKGLISAADAAELRAEVTDIMTALAPAKSKLIQTGVYHSGSRLDALINSAALLGIAAQLMGGESTLYLPFTAVKSEGGGGEFHFHQDNQYTRFDGPGNNMWFALDHMTEQNGCLRIIPRSHLAGTRESRESPDADGHRTITYKPEEFTSLLMEPGDCVAFTRLTVHGSGPNQSDRTRVAYAVQFHRNDVRAIWGDRKEYTLLTETPRWQVGPAKDMSDDSNKSKG